MQSNNAGFLVRLFATLTDSLIELFIFVLGLYGFILMLNVENFVTSTLNLLLYFLLFILLTGVIRLYYTLYFISNFGGTIGKLLFNLNIVDSITGEYISMKRAFYRSFIGYAFSMQFFGWGFLRILKSANNKLAWHDELFNTKVISKGTSISGFMVFIGLLMLVGFVTFKTYTTFENSEYFKFLLQLTSQIPS